MALQTKDFTVTGKSSGGGITYTYILRVTENSISVPDNTSNITVQAILKQSYSGTAFQNWYTGVSCALGGSQIFSDYRQRQLEGKDEHTYYTWNGNVAHADDGTLNLAVSGKLWQSSYASFSPPAMTVPEGTMALTAIPRASGIAATDGAIAGSSRVTVDRHAGSFTHSIGWKFGSLSGYLTADGALADTREIFSQTTLDFLLPERFYDQIPNAASGICTLTCTTYNGAAVIGSSECAFTVRADERLCAPTLTASVEDSNPKTIALTGDASVLVRGQSHALCSLTAEAKNGASVADTRVAGVSVTDSCTIEAIETDRVVFHLTDSRGFTVTQTVQLPMVDYVPLTCNAAVKRTDPVSGGALLTLSGQCFAGSFGAADNPLTLQCQVGEQTLTAQPAVGVDNSYYVAFTLSDLDYTCAHTLTVTATDALEGVTRTLTLPRGEPVFDWGERDFRFHVPVTGDFSGSFQGVSLRTTYLNGTDMLLLQSRFREFTSGSNVGRHSLFVFGSANGIAVYGLLTVYSWGGADWAGTNGVSATVCGDGQVQLTMPRAAWDHFVVLSAAPFEIL